MSYKYEFKEYIRDEILSHINHMNILDDALDELDHVYTQAAKADEYEKNKYRTHVNDCKAEAFDAIMREWEDERMTKSHILKTIQEYYDEYESGEYDAKK